MCANQYGKRSHLSLTAALRGEKTILEDASFTAPFKVMDPFYPDGKQMRLMIMAASAGILGGVQQEISLYARYGSRLEIVSQSFEKIHRMENQASASRLLRITAEQGSRLFYHPYPTIPFSGSSFHSKTEIYLESGAQIVFQEILACGRASRNEFFQYRAYENSVYAWRDKKLFYRDFSYFDPSFFDLGGMGMYEKYTHLNNLLLFGIHLCAQDISNVQNYLHSRVDAEGEITQINKNDYLLRIMGSSSQQLLDISETILYKILQIFHSF